MASSRSHAAQRQALSDGPSIHGDDGLRVGLHPLQGQQHEPATDTRARLLADRAPTLESTLSLLEQRGLLSRVRRLTIGFISLELDPPPPPVPPEKDLRDKLEAPDEDEELIYGSSS